MNGLFANIAVEILAGGILLYAGAWIEDRFNLINRKKRNDSERVRYTVAHNCILQSELEKAGGDGAEKMNHAISLFQEHYPAIGYQEAYGLLSQVFVTTILYHNNSGQQQ